MAAVHYACNTLKIPGPSGVISIKAYVKCSVNCTERLYEEVATTSSDDVEHPESSAKEHLSPDSSVLTKMVHLRDDPEKTVTIGAELGET